jgi:hypothetical protein
MMHLTSIIMQTAFALKWIVYEDDKPIIFVSVKFLCAIIRHLEWMRLDYDLLGVEGESKVSVELRTP